MNYLKDFKHWKEVTKGFYVYATDSTSIKYEILVMYQKKGTDILDAEASLYCTSTWVKDLPDDFLEHYMLGPFESADQKKKVPDKKIFFEREFIFKGKFSDCMAEAVNDFWVEKLGMGKGEDW